ncbi:MAG: PAS domain S-box protein [Planctomycetaceae bacterium]|nr:PAS domain S-box protein [Planctomycetaceae bacterium]
MQTETPSAILRKSVSQAEATSLESLFRQFVESSALGILIADSEGGITYVNESLCRFFGYERRELLGQPVELLIPDDLRDKHVVQRDEYLLDPQKRVMHGREVRGLHKDGHEIIVAVGLTPLAQGSHLKIVCTIWEVSSSRRAEQTLANFFDLSIDLFCIANTDGHFLRVNPNFSRVLGYSDHELLERPFLDFVHPDDLEATREVVATLASGQPIVRFRNRYLTARGDYIWLEWNARMGGNNGVIFAVGRDVTEELRFQQELKVREEREQAILENTPAVVYVKDPEGRYLYANQRFVDLFALEHGSVTGKTDLEIFPRELAEAFRSNDQQVAASRSRITIEEQAPHADGLHTYVSVKFPLFDAAGHISSVAGISTDVTDDLRNKELQAQLQIASTFQRKLYPSHAPVFPGLDLAGSALPATHLCGDYYDFIPIEDGRVVLAVGDVSGHGFGPALAMVEVRSILRGMLHDHGNRPLSETLVRLNELLCEDLPEARFVTLFLVEIDTVTRRLHYAGAGHQAHIFRADGNFEVLNSTAPVIGLIDSISVREPEPVDLEAGDVLLICTDGITEAFNSRHQLYGWKRTIERVKEDRTRDAADIIRRLFAEVSEFAGQRGRADDMTAIVAKAVPNSPACLARDLDTP